MLLSRLIGKMDIEEDRRDTTLRPQFTRIATNQAGLA